MKRELGSRRSPWMDFGWVMILAMALSFATVPASAEDATTLVVPTGHVPSGTGHHARYVSTINKTHLGVDVWAKNEPVGGGGTGGDPIYSFAEGFVVATCPPPKPLPAGYSAGSCGSTRLAAYGTVSGYGYLTALGNAVMVKHPRAGKNGKDLYSIYLHLMEPTSLGIGTRVFPGSTVLGRVGKTGAANNRYHLHLEIRYFPKWYWTWANGTSNIYCPGNCDPRRVNTVNSRAIQANWEDPQNVNLLPLNPSRTFAAPLSSTSVLIGWNDKASNELQYRVYRWTSWSGEVWIGNLGANATSFTDTGLSSSTGYFYKVCAWSTASGSGPGSCDNWAYTSTPAPPPFGGQVFRVDGEISSARPQGEAFTFTGSGYAPWSQVDRWLYSASGSWTWLGPLPTNENGTLLWRYTPPCSASSLGTYSVYAGNNSIGWQIVTETITPGSCQ